MKKIKSRTLIFSVCYIAYTWVYVARLNLSAASPNLTGEKIITTGQLGLLNGSFFAVYALGRLLNGRLSDKIAPYIMLAAGLAACGAGNLLFGALPPFAVMLVTWSVNAFAQSMLWSSVLCSVAYTYPAEKARKMTSYMVTSVAFGNIVGIVIGSALVNRFGLGAVFVVPGGIALLLSAVCAVALRKIPAPEAAAEKKHISVAGLLRDTRVKMAAAAAFCHGIIKDNITAWVTLFFADTYGIELSKVAGFVLFIPLVGFVGRMLYPPLYKLCGAREHTVSLMGVSACALCSAALLIPGLPAVMSIIMLSLIYMAVSLINTSLLSIFPLWFAQSGNVASVSGLMDFGTYLGAGVGSVVLGYSITHLGYGSMFTLWLAAAAVAAVPIIGLVAAYKSQTT